jgi:hypothetical protein
MAMRPVLFRFTQAEIPPPEPTEARSVTVLGGLMQISLADETSAASNGGTA